MRPMASPVYCFRHQMNNDKLPAAEGNRDGIGVFSCHNTIEVFHGDGPEGCCAGTNWEAGAAATQQVAVLCKEAVQQRKAGFSG